MRGDFAPDLFLLCDICALHAPEMIFFFVVRVKVASGGLLWCLCFHMYRFSLCVRTFSSFFPPVLAFTFLFLFVFCIISSPFWAFLLEV